jgi:hypothetical protein
MFFFPFHSGPGCNICLSYVWTLIGQPRALLCKTSKILLLRYSLKSSSLQNSKLPFL